MVFARRRKPDESTRYRRQNTQRRSPEHRFRTILAETEKGIGRRYSSGGIYLEMEGASMKVANRESCTDTSTHQPQAPSCIKKACSTSTTPHNRPLSAQNCISRTHTHPSRTPLSPRARAFLLRPSPIADHSRGKTQPLPTSTLPHLLLRAAAHYQSYCRLPHVSRHSHRHLSNPTSRLAVHDQALIPHPAQQLASVALADTNRYRLLSLQALTPWTQSPPQVDLHNDLRNHQPDGVDQAEVCDMCSAIGVR